MIVLLWSLLGGALIGLAASWFWATNGRVAGVSGLVYDAAFGGPISDRRLVSVAFVLGLLAVGIIDFALFSHRLSPPPTKTTGALLIAGALVGFGTRLARGCTSGHGVCGISRLSLRSVVATVIFVGTGMLTVALL